MPVVLQPRHRALLGYTPESSAVHLCGRLSKRGQLVRKLNSKVCRELPFSSQIYSPFKRLKQIPAFIRLTPTRKALVSRDHTRGWWSITHGEWPLAHEAVGLDGLVGSGQSGGSLSRGLPFGF